MGGLQHRYRAHARAGYRVDRSEHMQTPRHPARVQLVFGQTRDGGQATGPAVVGEVVHDELVGLDWAGHPRWVGQRIAFLNPQSQLCAHLCPLAALAKCPFLVGGHTCETVEKELVVGDLGRHPVHLRIDRREPTNPHGYRRLSAPCFRLHATTASSASPGRRRVSARRSPANSPAAVTDWYSWPGGPTACGTLRRISAAWHTCCRPIYRTATSVRSCPTRLRRS